VLRLIGRRVLGMIPTVILVSMLAYGLVYLVPGDPAVALAGENPSPGQVEAIRHSLGLDRSIVSQYLHWAGNALHGQFGSSLFNKFPVRTLISTRLPVTIALAITSVILAVFFGVLFALIAANWKGRPADRAVTTFASLGVAIPPFWLGLLLVIVFTLKVKALPSIGYTPLSDDPVGWARHIILPAITLAAGPSAEIARQVRGSLVGVLGNDYIRTARAKGIPRSVVLFKHALKNAGVPAVTVIGSQFSYLLGGAVIVEQIYGIPGMGSLAVTAVLDRDVPVIQAVILVAALAVLLVNLLVDISYGYFNPKVRLT
jgi:peptide/nickel transport system permease protein